MVDSTPRDINNTKKGNKSFGNYYTQIYVLGDFHIGNKNYRGDLLEKTLKTIYNECDAKIIGMGDYCEFINERSFKYESQTMSPKKQFKELKRLLKPFADEYRIITLLKGNHEDRYFTKLDGLEDYCDNNQIDYNGRHHLFKYKKKYFYAHHPQSSATTTAGRDRVFQKMRNIQEADVYLTGHFHSLFQEKFYRYNRERKLKEVSFSCTGSYLEYKDSYAELKLYTPNPIGCKKITLNKDKIIIEDFI